MAPVPVPETVEVRMQFNKAGQQCENVYHVRTQGVADQTKLTQIADLFRNWWVDRMSQYTSNDLSLVRVIARQIHVQGGLAVESASGLPFANVDGGPGLPNNVTLAVKWGTGLAGRSYRGRTYHMGLTQGQLQGPNAVQPAHINQLRGIYDELRTALDNVALGAEFVVVSRYANGAPRAQGVTTPISGVSIDSTLDSQRRRLPGRGS